MDPVFVPTILVVEDDPAVGRLVRTILQRDANVHFASSAADAEEIALTLTRLDLLVTDFVLPDAGGLELAGLVRKTHPQARVLLTSGYLKEHIAAPEVAFLQKPFTPTELRARVAELLSQSLT